MNGLVSRSCKESPLTYKLPHADLVLIRGAGYDKFGRVVLEREPINLGLDAVLLAAIERGAKVVVQLPERLIEDSSFSYEKECFAEVIISPSALSADTYRNDYLNFPDPLMLSRDGSDVQSLANKLASRLQPNEQVIVGIGLPVPAVNRAINRSSVIVNVESGNIGGTPIDGTGFGISVGAQSRITQSEMFHKIWNGGIDHAILGVGDVSSDGIVNVAMLGDWPVGVGGFVDIVSSVKKITFCHRKKKKDEAAPAIPPHEWNCFSLANATDVEFIEVGKN